MTIDRKFFFDSIKTDLFESLAQSQVDGLNHLLDVWDTTYSKYPLSYLSYSLATTFHETARTMHPIEEWGHGQGRSYGRPAGPYNKVYYGRGFLQLTWLANYQKASNKLNAIEIKVDLVRYPEKALDPVIASHILFLGMLQGWFTGKKLSDYIPKDSVNARRIINGTDKAEMISGYYEHFVNALKLLPVES